MTRKPPQKSGTHFRRYLVLAGALPRGHGIVRDSLDGTKRPKARRLNVRHRNVALLQWLSGIPRGRFTGWRHLATVLRNRGLVTGNITP